MKKILFVTLTLLITSTSWAQTANADTVPVPTKWNDFSIFLVNQLSPKRVSSPLMWLSSENGKYFLEARMNFDKKNTAAIIVGKTFTTKKSNFWITPKAGVLFGFNTDGFNGFSAEINSGASFKKLRYFSMTQGAVSTDKLNPSFFYQYLQISYDLKYFTINCGMQFFKPLIKNTDVNIDIGPQIFIPIQKFYLKPWYTIDVVHPTTRKFIIGAGYRF